MSEFISVCAAQPMFGQTYKMVKEERNILYLKINIIIFHFKVENIVVIFVIHPNADFTIFFLFFSPKKGGFHFDVYYFTRLMGGQFSK